MKRDHTPGWKKIVIALSVLPLLWWPVSLLHDTGFLFTGIKRVLMMLFPIYALLSLGLAWYCRNERPEVMWVLLIVLWLSYAGIFTMVAI